MCTILTILSYEAQKQLFIVVTSVTTKYSLGRASLYNKINAFTTKIFVYIPIINTPTSKFLDMKSASPEISVTDS
jgi:hypothetical protein